MKKLLTLALATGMMLMMGVTAFANTTQLGNFVLTPDEIVTEEEQPAAELTPAEDQVALTELVPTKQNPNTGAADLSGLGATVALLATVGILVSRKK